MSQNDKRIKGARLLSLVQILLLTCALASAPVLPLSAQAQQPLISEARQYNIPAGPLDRALTQFIETSGLFLAGTADLATGVQSPGVQGSYTAEQALEQLLAGSGLSYRFSNANTITLEPAPAQQVGEVTLPMMVITGMADQIEGFRARQSSSATNVDAALIETPATVNVITPDFIEAIGGRRLDDVIQYVPGGGVSASNRDGTFQLNIRGFDTSQRGGGEGTGGVIVDSLRFGVRRYHYDPALYERIDILKGPGGLLYGAGSPGGTVRYVTKTPQFESAHRIEGTVGSYDTRRAEFDSTGALNESQTLAYRLVLVAQDANQTVHGRNDDISYDERFIFNPQLTWLTPGGGELRLSYEYSHHDSPLDYGIFRLNDGRFTFDTAPFLGPDSFNEREHHIGSVSFSQPLSEDWTLHLAGNYSQSDIEALWDFACCGPDTDNRGARITRSFPEDYDAYGLRAELKGKLQTGRAVTHDITLGVSRFKADGGNIQTQLFEAGAIDLTNPVFGPYNLNNIDPFPTLSGSSETSVYLQDFVSIGEQLKVFGGLRYQDVDVFLNFPTFDSFSEGADTTLDYTLGAIYNANSWFNPFVSYGTAMTSQLGRLVGGDLIPFKDATQIEIGNKSEWFDGRLATTVSIFQIEQTNIAESDLVNDGFSILVGDQRTRGLEFEAAGQIGDRFSLLAGYSYLDAEFTKSTTGDEGNTPYSVPKHNVSLFGQYNFDGMIDGLQAGLGVVYVGERFGDNANTYKLPTYTRVDAFAAYEFGHFDVSLSINNLLDKKYIEGSANDSNSAQGARRFFMLKVGYDF